MTTAPKAAPAKKRKILHRPTDSSSATKQKPTPVQHPAVSSSEDSSNAESFQDLRLCPALQKSITDLGLSKLSMVQRQVIPALLAQKDVVAISSQGSDSILSFLVPATSLLEKVNFKARHGTGVLVIAPTRESAVEVSALASELASGTGIVVGKVMEGANRGSEEKKLENGTSLLVATPERLLDHLRNSSGFVIENLKAVIIYGADKFVDAGAGQALKNILPFLPKERISAVFGGQATDELEGLANLFCQTDSASRYEDSSSKKEGLKETQGYVIVEPENRLLLLASFLKKFQEKKIIVKCSSTPTTSFYALILDLLDIPVQAIHGNLNRKERSASLAEYIKDPHGTLLCTDEALRELQIPGVDWVIQFDPPRSTADYISQIGSIAGRPVIFLQPLETGVVDALKSADMPVEEFEFPRKRLLKVQPTIEKNVAKVFSLNVLAKDAFRAFLQDYNIHPNPAIFDVTKLDITKLGKAFGFLVPPRVAVNTHEPEKVDPLARPYGPPRVQSGKRRRTK